MDLFFLSSYDSLKNLIIFYSTLSSTSQPMLTQDNYSTHYEISHATQPPSLLDD